MANIVAWADESQGYREVWYVDPIAEGFIDPSEDRKLIPLSEGWEDRLRVFEETLGENEKAVIVADGEYKVVKLPEPYVPPKSEWNQIADSLRAGVNTI